MTRKVLGRTLREQGTGINPNDYRARPSIIAHSFGTYIVGYAMQKYPDIQFDKIILCGSILPVDFDWSLLFHRDQVNAVRNEYGSRDFWTSCVGNFIQNSGASGAKGFQFLSTVVSQERFEYFGHSDYFHQRHIESHWLPVLRRDVSSLQIRHGRNMGPSITSFVEILNKTAAIDDACFSHLPNYRVSQMPRGLSTTWIEMNPDIYTFLFDRRRDDVCGYINAMPVQDQCFDRIKEGRVRDNEIVAKDILPFLTDQTLKLYLMSVVIDPALHNAGQGLYQEPFERLITGFVNKLYYYAVNHKIRVTELVAVGWTEPGRRLCQALGMENIGNDNDGNSIFWIDFVALRHRPTKIFLPGVKKLLDSYKSLDKEDGI